VLLIAVLCMLITIPCSGAWALFGSSMRRLLGDPKTARLFNFAMAALLAAWRFVPDRLPAELRPAELMMSIGIQALPAVKPAPPVSQFDE